MSDKENPCVNVFIGGTLGLLAGVFTGLGASYLFEKPLLFPGDIIVFCSLTCGLLGLIFGNRFVDWLYENVWHLWF